MKPKLFITRKLPQIAIESLTPHFEITVNEEDRVLSQPEIISGTQDKDALLCLLTDTIDKSVLDACPKLKLISNYAVGFNNIDIVEASRRKIPVGITPGILTHATADLTWALILAVTRKIVESDHYMRSGQFEGWAPNLFLGTELHGKTLGIIGMGRIGQAVCTRALGFGMKVVYSSRSSKTVESAKPLDLATLLQSSDIVSLHTPLTAETHHLIGAKELERMKKSAFIINTTRGAVIDEKALVQALKNGTIAGAGLDVYEQEPLMAQGLADLNNAVLLPHIGSATVETRTKMALLAAENAIAIIQGKKPYALANPEILYVQDKV